MVGFNFAIRKRLVNQNITNISQLVDRERWIEQLYKERDKSKKNFPNKKERVAFVKDEEVSKKMKFVWLN